MVFTKRLLATLLFLALSSTFVGRANASPMTYSGTFANDDTAVAFSFTTSTLQTYTFTTTSFATGGFVPVLTLFGAGGGVPLAFAETDMSDVVLTRTLGPGSYLLYLTEDPNVFGSTLAGGPLFAGMPTITGDLCGVSGGKFLNVFDNCSQRTANYALTADSVAAPVATPEPATLLLLLPPAAAAFAMRRRQALA